MKKYSIIMYLVDNFIYLYYKNELINYKVNKNILNNGKIVNPNRFIKSLSFLFKKNKVNKTLFNQNALIIVNYIFNKSDKYIMNNILNELSINKVNYLSDYELLNKESYLIINNSNLFFITNSNKFYIELNDLVNYELAIKLIKKELKKEIILIGNNDYLNKIHQFIEKKYNKSCYLIDEYKQFIINKAIKKYSI